MNDLPIEIVEQILSNFTNKKSVKEYRALCKASDKINKICQNDAKSKLRRLGYKVSSKNLDYVEIYIELLGLYKTDPLQTLVAAFIGGCHENKPDLIEFSLDQDIFTTTDTGFRSLMTNKTIPQIVDTCSSIATSKNYNTILKLLSQRNTN